MSVICLELCFLNKECSELHLEFFLQLFFLFTSVLNLAVFIHSLSRNCVFSYSPWLVYTFPLSPLPLSCFTFPLFFYCLLLHFTDKTQLRIYVDHWEQHMTLLWKTALLWFGSEEESHSSSQYLSFISQAPQVKWKPFPTAMCPPTANNRRGLLGRNYRKRSQGRWSQHVKENTGPNKNRKGNKWYTSVPHKNFCYYLYSHTQETALNGTKHHSYSLTDF